jgi:hypothetical protein
MNKKEFIEGLSTKDNLSNQKKIEICQYYIDNYPINIRGIITSLSMKISGGSDNAINFAYNQLKSRVKELNDFQG